MSSKSYNVIGKRHFAENSVEFVTGLSRYVGDLKRPGLLYGAVVRAGRSHARILRVDTSRAERAKGVACVITAADVPHNAYGPAVADQPVLCGEKVLYEGDPVAALCAESWEEAAEAARLVRVEYEDLPPVTDPEAALQPGSPILHESNPKGNLVMDGNVIRGDVEAGFAEADLIVEGCYTTQPQEHAAVEPHVCLVEPEPSGTLVVHVCSQTPFRIRKELCDVLKLPMSRVRVISENAGGAFGGKHEMMLESLAALCAMKTRRPITFRMSREEEFTVSTIRHSFTMDYKTGVTRDGRITAQQIRIIADGGAYASAGGGVISKGALMAPGPYRVDNLLVHFDLVYTNNGFAGAVRGFGATQTTYACERHMDHIARRLEMDPLDLRRRNAMRVGDCAHSGERIDSCGLGETIEKATRTIKWESIGGGRLSPCGTKRHGRGMASMIYPVAGFGRATPSAAYARVNEDGSMTVTTGIVDVGQGSNVILRQIAAEELGINFEHVQLINGDTSIAPLDPGSTASRITHLGGKAVRAAVGKVKEQLLEKAATMFEAAPEDLRIERGEVYAAAAPDIRRPLAEVAKACHRDSQLIVSEAALVSPDIGVDKATMQGRGFECYVFATQCAEVEVDVDTGEYRVLQLVCAHDVGKAINPMNVEAQIEGGSSMGYGLGMMEVIQMKDGLALNPTFRNYLIPTSLDAPETSVAIIVEAEEPRGPFGAKGVAEPSVNPSAPAILNAIEDACGACLTALPATPEAVLRAMRETVAR